MTEANPFTPNPGIDLPKSTLQNNQPSTINQPSTTNQPSTINPQRDEAGEEGASFLAADELTVTLAPGPPAALAFDGPAQLQVLSSLRSGAWG